MERKLKNVSNIGFYIRNKNMCILYGKHYEISSFENIIYKIEAGREEVAQYEAASALFKTWFLKN